MARQQSDDYFRNEMTMKAIRVVAATQASEPKFWTHTWLGRSLRRLPRESISVSVFADNRGNRACGLGSIYNQFLSPEYRSELLLFVHDDVWIHDLFLPNRLRDALQRFDVVGVA